jgi:hypothetical protein
VDVQQALVGHLRRFDEFRIGAVGDIDEADVVVL